MCLHVSYVCACVCWAGTLLLDSQFFPTDRHANANQNHKVWNQEIRVLQVYIFIFDNHMAISGPLELHMNFKIAPKDASLDWLPTVCTISWSILGKCLEFLLTLIFKLHFIHSAHVHVHTPMCVWGHKCYMVHMDMCRGQLGSLFSPIMHILGIKLKVWQQAPSLLCDLISHPAVWRHPTPCCTSLDQFYLVVPAEPNYYLARPNYWILAGEKNSLIW